MMNHKTTIFAKCPACGHSLRVSIGRRSTCETVKCESCGARYDYSAWRLSQPRADSDTVGRRTFYQVDLFPITNAPKGTV